MENRPGTIRLYSPTVELEPNKEVTGRVATSCLIGNIILDFPLLKEHEVKSIAGVAWKCKKDFSVSNIQENMFLFCFQDKQDWIKVLLDSPWNIKGGLLILSPWTSGKTPGEFDFSTSPFWVQVHGLPLDHMTEENGVKIGQFLGKFICVDNRFDGENVLWRKFFRIRVVLDIRHPLLTGILVKCTSEPGDIWVQFKYEKLGVFCYKCGRVGRHYWSCKFPEVKAKFGPWLSARPCFDALPTSSSTCGGAEVAETEARPPNTCTTLIMAPKVLQIPSSSRHHDDDQMDAKKMEKSGGHAGWQRQRLMVNNIDSMTMILNCYIIYNRVGAAKGAYEDSNERLSMVMAAYFVYMVSKLIRVVQKSWLLKACKAQAREEDDNSNGDDLMTPILDIFAQFLFLVMLKLF